MHSLWMMLHSHSHPQHHGTSTLIVSYAAATPCRYCCQSIGCCCCPAQPAVRGYAVEVAVDGQVLGKLQQGQSSSWTVHAGQHQVEARKKKSGAFVIKMLGGSTTYSIGTHTVTTKPNETSPFQIYWDTSFCGSTKSPRT